MGEREEGVVAARAEHVLKREGEQSTLAGFEATGALVLGGAGGDHDRDVVLVEDIQPGGGVLDVDQEVDERLDGDGLPLSQSSGALAVLVLDPGLGDARLAVAAPAFFYPLGGRLRIAP